MKLKIELEEGLEKPHYAHVGDACMDIRASRDVMIQPYETVAVPTGMKVDIPLGYELLIRPRSGVSMNTLLRMPNGVGVIDARYRDELKVLMWNASRTNNGTFDLTSKENEEGTYIIHKGDRIAQMILKKVDYVEIEVVNELPPLEIDRGGGFGSSGVK
jgi:dUTP pyrophosphatase